MSNTTDLSALLGTTFKVVTNKSDFNHLGNSHIVPGTFSPNLYNASNELIGVASLKPLKSSDLEDIEDTIKREAFSDGCWTTLGVIAGATIFAGGAYLIYRRHKNKKIEKAVQAVEKLAENSSCWILVNTPKNNLPQIYSFEDNNLKVITSEEYSERIKLMEQLYMAWNMIKNDTENCVVIDYDQIESPESPDAVESEENIQIANSPILKPLLKSIQKQIDKKSRAVLVTVENAA